MITRLPGREAGRIFSALVDGTWTPIGGPQWLVGNEDKCLLLDGFEAMPGHHLLCSCKELGELEGERDNLLTARNACKDSGSISI